MKARIVAVLLLLGACKEAPQVHQEWLNAPPTLIEFGAPFDVELRQICPAGWQPDAWSLNAFSPFEAELLEESRTETQRKVEVRRKLRLRGYVLGVQPLKLSFFALDPAGGGRVSAADLEAHTTLQSSLPGGGAALIASREAGPMEFPQKLAASKSTRPARRDSALVLLLVLIGGFAARAGWRRRAPAPRLSGVRADLWARFRTVQNLPRSSEAQRRAALLAARALVRELESNQAWAAPELAQRLARRFALPRTEAASLLHFLHETEAAVFADQQDALPALDPTLDELAEVLRAVDPEEVR
jgi:hypothetical protein